MEPPIHPEAPPATPAAPAPRRAPPAKRALGLPLLLAASAMAVTLFVTRPSQNGARVFAPTPTLLGAPISLDSDPAPRIRAALRAHLRASIVLTLGGVHRSITREALGARVDEVRLSALSRDLRDPESALSKALVNMRGKVELPLPILLDAKAAVLAVSSIKDDLDEPARDAKLDIEHRKVIAEEPGRRVDVYSTIAAIELALRTGETTVAIANQPVAPALTQSALANVEMTDTLGYFETKYATDHKHLDRTFNLRLAASRLNGKVIMPGETFDFNMVVGPRDEAHGYRVAKVIADGELIDGIGGGTCQIAGTLHGAALFAGLEVVQRTPHTRPSYYIKMGLDAAVAYPHVTLKLRNPFDHPVVLKETVTGGMVRAEVLGPKRTRIVTFIRKIDDVIPFAEREVKDDRLPKGVRVLTQRGIPGFKVRRYRIVREGSVAIREKTNDSYPPTQQIVHVGTGESPGGRPPEDDHPEYVADEYLAITQGPGIGQKGSSAASELSSGPAPSGTEEVRVAGKTGTRGWTRKYTIGHVTSPNGKHEEESGETDTDAPKEASEGASKPKLLARKKGPRK